MYYRCALLLILLTCLPVIATEHRVLILAETVTTPANSSREYLAVIAAGIPATNIDVVAEPVWSTYTPIDFSLYQALIIGDPSCNTPPLIQTALDNIASAWTQYIDGNIVIIGTDPVFHKFAGGYPLIDAAIAFVLSHSNPVSSLNITGTRSAIC